MDVFLCHASQDGDVAERIQLSLIAGGHNVFFDAQSLPAAGDYQARIKAAIDRSDLFVFLITPNSIAKGKFTLSELQMARDRWPAPGGHGLGVTLAGVPVSSGPNYLRATPLLSVAGDPAVEVRAVVEHARNDPSR